MGSDVGLHVGKNFVDSFPERVYTSTLIPLLNQHKRLGEKTKAGFYKYDDRRRASPDPQIAAIIKVGMECVYMRVWGASVVRMLRSWH